MFQILYSIRNSEQAVARHTMRPRRWWTPLLRVINSAPKQRITEIFQQSARKSHRAVTPCPTRFKLFWGDAPEHRVSIVLWNVCGQGSESFCFVYHWVIIEEMCFSPHLQSQDVQDLLFFFFLTERKRLQGSNASERYSCQASSEGN